MKVTVLIDNVAGSGLAGEWGLSFYIEFKGKKYLLDAGASGRFAENARRLGIDLGCVDCAVLSHAHFDHSRGMKAFFEANSKAPFVVSPAAQENCYSGVRFFKAYIGVPKGVLSKYAQRISRPEGVAEIGEDVYIVPHSTAGLEVVAVRSHLYLRRGFLRFEPDDFSHEQSLVFRTGDGLVVFNSCSHSGADVVVEEVRRAFPGEQVVAYLGGLHLFRLTDDEVQAVASRIEAAGIKLLYTGHCTGDRAFEILRSRFGEGVQKIHSGIEISL